MAKDRYHDWYKLYDKLSVEINPNPEELKQLFDQESPIDPINLRGLELKFEAATREQTVIEKTMSPFQLYQTNNPLWKYNLSGYNISCVKYGQEKFNNKNLTLTKKDFEILSYCTDTYTVDCHIEWRLANRKD